MKKSDAIVIGSGPGGYVAALRLSQLGKRTILVERENLGGVCLNWGCIPTKALLESAHVCDMMRRASVFGVEVSGVSVHFDRIIERSREVAATMSRGVEYLLNKANVEVVFGHGRLSSQAEDGIVVEVTAEDGSLSHLQAKDVILATGARSREFPFLPLDGKRVFGYREALTLKTQPSSMVVIGSGAIGSELAHFYNSIGTKVTLIEALSDLLPLEDEEVSRGVGRAFRKAKVKTMVDAQVQRVDRDEQGCKVHVRTNRGEEVVECDVVLAAMGIAPNTQNLGLEELDVIVELNRVKVDEHYRTNIPGIYAIGDIIPTVALAHVASAEAIHCAEFIAGHDPEPINYAAVPACTFTTPEVASVGVREQDLRERDIPYIVGKFPFTASGRATASGNRDGFVKLLFLADGHKLVGAHILGSNATEMIGELAIALRMGATAETIHDVMHAHPTLGEGIMEAAAVALDRCVHL